MSYQRAIRIAEEIRRELSDIFRNHVKDPRINDMVSILRARVSKGSSLCKNLCKYSGRQERKKKMLWQG